ncbi:hypothetical protein D1872_325770 [compost metagenome]
MLASLRRSQCNLLVRVTGCVDVNDINVIPNDQLPPVCHALVPAQLVRCLLHSHCIPSANDGHLWIHCLWEEHWQTTISVAVRFSHEFVPDHADS